MWGNDKSFFDVLSMASGSSDSYALQTFIEAFKERYNKLEVNGFGWAAPQYDFSFQQLSKEYGINGMATYVDIDSSGTPITTEGVELQTGNIPRMKKYAAFDEKDYRKELLIAAVGSDPQASAQRLMFNAVKKLIDSHTNSLTYQRHQMVSAGKFELTAANNAGGITGTVFKASIPTENITTKTSTAKWWDGDDADGSTSDPIKDLKDIGQKAEERGSAYHWEVDKITFNRLLRHAKVVQAIGYHLFPQAASATIANNVASNSGRDAQKAALEAIIGFPIVVIDSISRVDSFDKAQNKVVGREVRSFKPNVFTLVPDGQIGEILSVVPIKVDPNGSYADYYSGRLLMSYAYNTLKKTQIIETEMTALVVPDKPKYMYQLNIA